MTQRSQARRRKGAGKAYQPPRTSTRKRDEDAVMMPDAIRVWQFWQEFIAKHDPLFVYFISEDYGDCEFVKIGQAKDPIKRVQTLQCGNPRKLLIEMVVLADDDLEDRLHRMFAGVRGFGEWFGGGLMPIILQIAEEIAASQAEAFAAGADLHSVNLIAHSLLTELQIETGNFKATAARFQRLAEEMQA